MLGIFGNWLAIEIYYGAGNEITGEQINESDDKDYDC
jgi:hypothetical protein